MREQREILRQKVVEVVKDFVENEGGITMFDLQILFGNPIESLGSNEVFSALRLNGFDQNGSDLQKPRLVLMEAHGSSPEIPLAGANTYLKKFA